MNNKAIGKRIKSIRKNLGLTTEKFADLFDPPASKGTISKWENGHYLPNNERLKLIAELGNMSVDQLLYGSKEEYIHRVISDYSKKNDQSLELMAQELTKEYILENYPDVYGLDEIIIEKYSSVINANDGPIPAHATKKFIDKVALQPHKNYKEIADDLIKESQKRLNDPNLSEEERVKAEGYISLANYVLNNLYR